jgi:ATP-dependent DNA helicase RecG
MLKSVSAFANEHDGWILFGVSDQGEVFGITNGQQLRLKVENAINDNIQPRPYYEIESQQADGHDVLIVKVFKGEYTPYFYNSKAYIRSDTASVEADRTRLNQLILAGQNIFFDQSESPEQTLTFDNLERFMRQRLKISRLNKDLLRTLDLVRKDKYTNAAALLSDQNPVNHAVLTLIAYSSDLMNIVDRKILDHQSVLIQFESSLQFLYKHSQVSEIITGAYRQTIEEIPLIAYREAIANAIVHRDYQSKGQIKVEFYADRVEIISPGSLPAGISRDEYLDGRLSIPRNRVLSDVFLRLGIIEKLATGIRRIKECYQSFAKKPVFLVYENCITVVLPKTANLAADMSQETYVEQVLTDDEERILEYLRGNNSISRLEVSKLLELGKTRSYQLINGLIQKNIIYPVGSGKNIQYKRIGQSLTT